MSAYEILTWCGYSVADIARISGKTVADVNEERYNAAVLDINETPRLSRWEAKLLGEE